MSLVGSVVRWCDHGGLALDGRQPGEPVLTAASEMGGPAKLWLTPDP